MNQINSMNEKKMKRKFGNQFEKCNKIKKFHSTQKYCRPLNVSTDWWPPPYSNKVQIPYIPYMLLACWKQLIQNFVQKLEKKVCRKETIWFQISILQNLLGRLSSIYSVNLESLAQYFSLFVFFYTFCIPFDNLVETAVCLLTYFFSLFASIRFEWFLFLWFFVCFGFFLVLETVSVFVYCGFCSSYLPWWLGPECWSETMHANHFVLNQLMTFAAWMRPLIVIHHRPKWIVRVVRCLCVPWLMNDRGFVYGFHSVWLKYVVDWMGFGYVCVCVLFGALCSCVCVCV